MVAVRPLLGILLCGITLLAAANVSAATRVSSAHAGLGGVVLIDDLPPVPGRPPRGRFAGPSPALPPLDSPRHAVYFLRPMNPASRSLTATVAARIPYANAAPFYALWGDAPFAVRNLVPSDLGREAEAGGLDVGLMASGDFLRLRDRFELLVPAMGLATHGPAMSVLLFSRRPASALANAMISVTPETSTSIRLLRLLLDVRRELPGVRYLRGLEPAQADALLVIGDRAMRMRNSRPAGFTHTLDLGADWLEWTGLPFVYAVWAVRSALEPALKAELAAFLESSLAAGLADLTAVARQQTEPGWSVAETEEYLRRFHYRLGPEHLKGLERFEELLRKHGRLEQA